MSFRAAMKQSKEQERSREELVPELAEGIIEAALLDDPLSLKLICKSAKISEEEWWGVKSQVESYIADRYEGGQLLVEHTGKRKGSDSRRFNVYIKGRLLSCCMGETIKLER